MGFTNPASTVELAAGAVVGISGTVDASGSTNLGVSTTVSAVIPASDVASASGSTAGVQLLPNATGSTQYILISAIIRVSGTGKLVSLAASGTDSDTLLSVQNDSSGGVINQQFNLENLTLPTGAGVSVVTGGSGSWAVSLYYASISSTFPHVSGNVVSSGGIL